MLGLFPFRRLLFTDDSLLQHELGEGQTAFPRYKRSHPASSPPKVVKEEHPPSSPPSGSETGAEGGGRGEPEGGEVEPETLSSSLATNTDSSITDCAAGEKVISDASSKQTSEHSTSEGVPPASSQGEDSPSSASTSSLPALTIADLARVRAQVASVVALGNQSSVSSACSSYFIEPVEWMGELLLGEVEGKVRVKGRVRDEPSQPCVHSPPSSCSAPSATLAWAPLTGRVSSAPVVAG